MNSCFRVVYQNGAWAWANGQPILVRVPDCDITTYGCLASPDGMAAMEEKFKAMRLTEIEAELREMELTYGIASIAFFYDDSNLVPQISAIDKAYWLRMIDLRTQKIGQLDALDN